MARPAKFSVDDLLDGALAAAYARGRSATVADVAAAVGAPTGSIYHRFVNREELFASLWLRSIARFHEGLLETGHMADPKEALLRFAVHIPRYCRAHPDEAAAMTLYRQPDLATRGPESLRDQAARINDGIIAMLLGLGTRAFGELTPRRQELLVIAVQETPYGLVRRYISVRRPIPEWLDEVVRVAAAAILDLGDSD